MFLNFSKSEPRCSYKQGSYKKKSVKAILLDFRSERNKFFCSQLVNELIQKAVIFGRVHTTL